MLSIRAHASGAVTVATVIVWFFIPVIDCLRLMITRRMSGRSPLSADRDHFHHRLEATIWAHVRAWDLSRDRGRDRDPRGCSAAGFPSLCIVALVIFYGGAIWRTAERPQHQIVFRFDRLPGYRIVNLREAL